MKIRIKALKKLYFFDRKEVRYVHPGEYAEIEDKLLNKFLKLKAVEVIATGEEKKIPFSNDCSAETELPDIVAVVEKMDAIKEKSELILYGNSLGIQNLTMEMSVEEIKATIVNGLENANDI